MKKTKPLPLRLHRDFIAVVRTAWTPIVFAQRSRRGYLPYWVGALYWETEPGYIRYAPKREMRRLQRLAHTLRYRGPIVEAAA